MGALSNYAKDKMLNHLFNNVDLAPTASVYLALCTTTPDATKTGATIVECANSGNYARKPIPFSAAGTRKVIQNGIVSFNLASGSWGTVAGWAIVDSATWGAGNMLAFGAFTTPFAVVSGNTPSIPDTQVQVQIQATAGGAGITDYAVHKLLDRLFRNQTFACPVTYLSLFTAVLADSTTAFTNELPSTNSFARKLVNPNGGAAPAWTLSSAGGGTLNNGGVATFASPTGAWATFTSLAIVDVVTLGSGNILGYDNTNVVDQGAASGDTVQFNTSGLTVTLS